MRGPLFAALIALLLPLDSSALSYRKFRLDNGLRVILHRSAAPGLVNVYVWYKVGSFDEPPGRSGFAHFFEHYLFKDTKHFKGLDLTKYVTGAGGYLNASTGQDRTDYITTLPENELERWLRVEASRMQHMTWDEKHFTDEREIVLGELQRRRVSPYGDHVWEVFFKNMFPDGHPYQILPIGSEKDLRAATLSDAEQFYRTYYWPENAVLVVSGDVDFGEAETQVRRWFSPLKPSPAGIPQRAVPEGPPSKARDEMLDPHARLPMVLRAWRIPGKFQPGHVEMTLLAKLLAARLSEKLVVESEDAVDVDQHVFRFQRESVLVLFANPKPRKGEPESAALRRVEAAMSREIAAVMKGELDAARLREESGSAELGLRASFEDVDDNELQSSMAECELVAGDPACYEREVDALRSVTPGAALSLARRHLTPERETVLWIRTPGGSR